MDSIQYERISDDVCFLGNNALLRFNVSLARKDKSNNRNHYHTEYVYDGDKYINAGDLVSLKRNFQSYLTIEMLRYDGKKPWIQITANDMIPLRMVLDNCMKWFLDAKYKNLFVYNKQKELTVYMQNLQPVQLKTFNNIILEFTPCVVDEFDRKVEGIRISLGSKLIFIDLSVSSFMGFKYHIDGFNMFQSAQIMINYIGKPNVIKRIRVDMDMRSNSQSDIMTKVSSRVPRGEQQEMSLDKQLGGL